MRIVQEGLLRRPAAVGHCSIIRLVYLALSESGMRGSSIDAEVDVRKFLEICLSFMVGVPEALPVPASGPGACAGAVLAAALADEEETELSVRRPSRKFTGNRGRSTSGNVCGQTSISPWLPGEIAFRPGRLPVEAEEFMVQLPKAANVDAPGREKASVQGSAGTVRLGDTDRGTVRAASGG